jgi:N-acetylmuramoyl-L-alanine amidase
VLLFSFARADELETYDEESDTFVQEFSEDDPETLLNYAQNVSLDQIMSYIKLLIPDEATRRRYFDLTADSLIVKEWNKSKKRPKKLIEIPLAVESIPRPRLCGRHGGMKGLKVLLDAGNWAGTLAKLEGKYFEPSISQLKKWGFVPEEQKLIAKGEITLDVAKIARGDLEQLGAQVFMTRETVARKEITDPSFDREFNREYEEAVQRALDHLLRAREGRAPRKYEKLASTSASRLYRLYKQFDLRRRGDLAEKIRPDLTVSIHANAGGDAALSTSHFTESSGVEVFIPGNLKPDALDSVPEITQWARRMVDGTMPDTFGLAVAISKGIQASTDQVAINITSAGKPQPKKTRSKKGKKLNRVANWKLVDKENGVYAWRELPVLRRVPGPIVLTEGFFYNNVHEYRRLIDMSEWSLVIRENTKSTSVPREIQANIYQERLVEYARGIVEGIRKYVESSCEESRT